MTPGAVEAFRRPWTISTLTAAAVVTACDAALLERSKSYFSGGFLSVDHLTGWGDASMFLAASLLLDAAVVGLVAAVIAWTLSRFGLRPAACIAAGVLLGAGILLGADVISYQILRYLGDAFDLALMLDLAGGSVSELFAVSSVHLIATGLVVLAGLAVVAALVWVVNRRASRVPAIRFPIRVLAAPMLLAAISSVTVAVAANSSDTLENGLLRKPAGRVVATAVNAVTDLDRDGFGLVGRSADPDPLDGSIFPYAVDLPGNGIDEDGVAGDLPPDQVLFRESPLHPSGWQRRPDVLLFVLESFRADLVGARLDGRPVTPVIDALAARGISVGQAFSHNGYTVQSRHHLFTGSLLAAPAESTLVDDFLANGYVVGYFSAQDESFGGPRYDVGFTRATVASDSRADKDRRYSTSTTAGSLVIPATVVQERIGEFLHTHASSAAPLFVYANFQETHFPYSHPGVETLISPVRLAQRRIGPGERDRLWRTYANTAANVDRAIGQVLDAVRRARGAEPGVIVTADHGESLFDEGFLGHGYALNDVQTRIPLVAANLPMQVPEPFGQADLRSTLGKALQQPPGVPAVPSVHPVSDRAVFQYLGDITRPAQIAFVQSGGRVIYDFRTRRVQLPHGGWYAAEALPTAQRDPFTRLVHWWEAIVLRRRNEAAEKGPTTESLRDE